MYLCFLKPGSKKSITDRIIGINGYNVFHTDHKSKGGGVAVYVKDKFSVVVLTSVTKPKQFEYLSEPKPWLIFKYCCILLLQTSICYCWLSGLYFRIVITECQF
jgi:hypothetical protein